MKTYTKRIGFLISSECLKPVGGVGQFAKSFCEMMDKHGIRVDLIMDKQPNHAEFAASLPAGLVYPDTSLSYGAHTSIFMYEDSYCLERMINFRNATIKALSTNLYDVFVCNTHEAIQVAITLGLEDCIQIIGYTHFESQIFKQTKTPFLDCANDMMRKQMSLGGLYVGTQSIFNRCELERNHDITAYHLPIPIPEPSILEEHNKPREGVLFIGRWEEGKNPELFIELIEKTKLPARVLTSESGVKKFEKALSKLGVDYQIKAGIVGVEKVDYITSCRVAFNPSTVESYGIAFLEQQVQMPTVALEGSRWLNNFISQHYYTCTKKTMADIVSDLYSQYDTAQKWYDRGVLKFHKEREENVFMKWFEAFNEYEPRKSNSNSAKILEHTTIQYRDHVANLARTVLCIDDIRSALTNRHKYRVIYTDQDTWLTRDPNFTVPEDDTTGLFIFQ